MIDSEKIFKPEILALQRVKDTFDDRFEYLRLDKNERLQPFPEPAFGDFIKSLSFDDLAGYPELGPLYRKLASWLGVTDEHLLLAAGSDLAIKSVYEAAVGKGDRVILHAPSYAMYRVYAKMFGAEAVLMPVRDDWRPDIEGMLAKVDDRTKLVALENPNGFVGSEPTPDELDHAAKTLAERNVLLVVDEAYFYVERPNCETHRLLEKYDNVIVSQTFSKAHGLAGLRLGYLITAPRVMEIISRVRPMHEVTSLTMRAAEWLLDHPEFLAEFQREIRRSKDLLRREMESLGVGYRETKANFVLLKFPVPDMEPRLKKEHRILIRRPFEEPALKGWSRVCVGSTSETECLVEAVRAVLGR